MNNNQKQILLGALAMCLANIAVAQIITESEITSNAEVKAQLMRSNVEARIKYYRQHPTKEQLERMSNAMLYMHPTPWPDSPQKLAALAHCADVLRSAIDTNQIAVACNKMTNQAEAVLELKNISSVAISNLDELASLLTNTNLMTYRSWWAEFSTSTNKVYFLFWSQDGPVRQLDERPADGRRVLVGARFNEAGKLLEFELNIPDTNGVSKAEMELIFNDDGTLRSFWKRPPEAKP